MKRTSTLVAALALTLTSASMIAVAGDTPAGAGKHANPPTGEGPSHQDAGAPYGPPGHAGDPGKKSEETSRLATDSQKDDKTDPDWEHGNPPHGTPEPGGPGGGPGWAEEKGQ